MLILISWLRNTRSHLSLWLLRNETRLPLPTEERRQTVWLKERRGKGLRKDIKSLLKEQKKNPTLTVRPLRTVWLRVFSPWNFGEMDLEMKGEYQDAAFCSWENMFFHGSNHNEDLQDFPLLWSLPLSIIGLTNGNPDSVFHHVERSDKDSPVEKDTAGLLELTETWPPKTPS